ncbi:MAG: dihydrofolate reductase [Rhodocyclaceae bacterium]|nr:dihydrofolate reductase [Rhodocyclaceae bacterium]
MNGLTLVAAVAKNGVIGDSNALPWHLPEDLKHFKQLTSGHAVIMGRKTWESLPLRFRPLPGRLNIVLTRDPRYVAEGAMVVHTLQEALKVGAGPSQTDSPLVGGSEPGLRARGVNHVGAGGTAPEETRRAAPSVSSPPGGGAPHGGAFGGGLFVIGGAELYAHALPLADRLELTEIDRDFPGDVFFPEIAPDEWREISRQPGISSNGLRYAFTTYERTQST